MATKTKTPKRPHGSSLSDFQPLKPAEEKLLEHVRLGKVCRLNNGKRPAADMTRRKARDAITIRSEFLRFLAIGGDNEAPVHARGVQFSGAWIDCEDCHGLANLDLENCNIPHDLAIINSIIHGYVTLMGASAKSINFGGTHIVDQDSDGDSFVADRMSTSGACSCTMTFLLQGRCGSWVPTSVAT
jgi:hypothetical protein